MTSIDTTELAGVSVSHGWRFVQVSDPALVATWQAAREAYDAAEPGYQRRAAKFQRDRNCPRHRPRSKYAKALEEAAAVVEARVEDLLVSGAVVYAGHRSGNLGGTPEPIPLNLLGARRPRGGRLTVRGTDFFDVKLYSAAALAEPKVEPDVDTPPATLGRLAEVLIDLFHEERAWAKAGDARLAEIVAARDPRFRPHTGPAKHGRWGERTLRQKIKETRAEAKVEAGL